MGIHDNEVCRDGCVIAVLENGIIFSIRLEIQRNACNSSANHSLGFYTRERFHKEKKRNQKRSIFPVES